MVRQSVEPRIQEINAKGKRAYILHTKQYSQDEAPYQSSYNCHTAWTTNIVHKQQIRLASTNRYNRLPHMAVHCSTSQAPCFWPATTSEKTIKSTKSLSLISFEVPATDQPDVPFYGSSSKTDIIFSGVE